MVAQEALLQATYVGKYERQLAHSNQNEHIMFSEASVINLFTSRELHNSSMMPPGRGRLVGLKRGFTSLSGDVKSICSRRSGDFIRFSIAMRF